MEEESVDDMTRQGMIIMAYEELIRKQCVMIVEYEKTLKETLAKLMEKDGVIDNLSRIIAKHCSALAKMQEEKIKKGGFSTEEAAFRDLKKNIAQAKACLLAAIERRRRWS